MSDIETRVRRLEMLAGLTPAGDRQHTLKPEEAELALVHEKAGMPPRVAAVRAMEQVETLHTDRRAGFTLIELLLVIAIVSVLLSLVLPALSGARRASGDSRCLQNAHALARATSSYYLAFGRFGHDLGEIGTIDGPRITCPEDPLRQPFSYVWHTMGGGPLGSAPLNAENTADAYDWSAVRVVSDGLGYRHNLRGEALDTNPATNVAQWLKSWRFWGFLDGSARPLRGPTSTTVAGWMP